MHTVLWLESGASISPAAALAPVLAFLRQHSLFAPPPVYPECSPESRDLAAGVWDGKAGKEGDEGGERRGGGTCRSRPGFPAAVGVSGVHLLARNASSSSSSAAAAAGAGHAAVARDWLWSLRHCPLGAGVERARGEGEQDEGEDSAEGGSRLAAKLAAAGLPFTPSLGVIPADAPGTVHTLHIKLSLLLPAPAPARSFVCIQLTYLRTCCQVSTNVVH